MQTLNSKLRLQSPMLPSEIMYNILSRMPVKSLARFRCVSKLWYNYINDPYLETMHAKRASVNDPTLIMLHQFVSNSPCTLSFSECKEEAGTLVLEVKKKQLACSFRHPIFVVIGSCNGLLYLSKLQDYITHTLVVIHPLREECYELPPIETPFNCRLGFDDSTNTFKMVCLTQAKLRVESPNSISFTPDLCPMVHVLGTDSWREIPKALSGNSIGKGVFANGCLHWLKRCKWQCDNCTIIRFDLKTEEFGLIKTPRIIHHEHGRYYDRCLVDLHGQLGFVYHMDRSVEVWVLKDRGWVMHCEFEQKPPLSGSGVTVLGFWNKNGDILVRDNLKYKRWFVYNLESRSMYEVCVVGLEKKCAKEIRLYQSSLFMTRYSIKNLRKIG